MISEQVRTRVAGLVGLVVVLSLIGIALGAYQKVFTDVVTVTVDSPRAGLLLDKGAKVRAFGLDVGEVRKVALQADNSVVVTIAIKPDSAKLIPKGVTANVGASTVFGAKIIELDVPAGPVLTPIGNNDIIAANRVTSEANDLFEDLNEVLTAVNPQELNATLTSIATSLDGRGRQLGSYFTNINTYVKGLNEHTDNLTADIDRSASVLNLYADTASDFLTIGKKVSVTSNTLSGKKENFDESLRSINKAAAVGADFLNSIAEPLDTSMGNARRTLSLTGEFRSVIECTLVAFSHHTTVDAPALGGPLQPGVQGDITFMPAMSGYTYPKNLPTFEDTQGPDCYGQSREAYAGNKSPATKHEYFRDGTQGIYTKGGAMALGSDPVVVYGELVKSFFGDAGLARLLGGEDTP